MGAASAALASWPAASPMGLLVASRSPRLRLAVEKFSPALSDRPADAETTHDDVEGLRSRQTGQRPSSSKALALDAEVKGLGDLFAEVKANRDELRQDRDEWRGRATGYGSAGRKGGSTLTVPRPRISRSSRRLPSFRSAPWDRPCFPSRDGA